VPTAVGPSHWCARTWEDASADDGRHTIIADSPDELHLKLTEREKGTDYG
jgi:hypothetical protein